MQSYLRLFVLAVPLLVAGCSDDGDDGTQTAAVSLRNDFNNPEFDRRPPWTICEAHYGGTEFGTIGIGETSDALDVSPGLGFVYMVAAWDDPACTPENCLPIASRQEEEVVPGRTRTIAINVPNHQGPCPPEGVEPMPQALYDRVLELWPEYGFLPYEQRSENPECLTD